jgi:hypothetical protein
MAKTRVRVTNLFEQPYLPPFFSLGQITIQIPGTIPAGLSFKLSIVPVTDLGTPLAVSPVYPAEPSTILDLSANFITGASYVLAITWFLGGTSQLGPEETVQGSALLPSQNSAWTVPAAYVASGVYATAVLVVPNDSGGNDVYTGGGTLRATLITPGAPNVSSSFPIPSTGNVEVAFPGPVLAGSNPYIQLEAKDPAGNDLGVAANERIPPNLVSFTPPGGSVVIQLGGSTVTHQYGSPETV